MVTLAILAAMGWAMFLITAYMLKRANTGRDAWFSRYVSLAAKLEEYKRRDAQRLKVKK